MEEEDFSPNLSQLQTQAMRYIASLRELIISILPKQLVPHSHLSPDPNPTSTPTPTTNPNPKLIHDQCHGSIKPEFHALHYPSIICRALQSILTLIPYHQIKDMGLSFVLLLLCIACAVCIASSALQGLPSTSPSLYVFGASLVDTGENSVAMPFRSNADFDPYGSDYFGKPTGRWSNGRNFMDLITQELGFGFLPPFLKAYGTDFTFGINFASSGSFAQNKTAEGSDSGGLFCLLLQVDQFREYQAYVLSQQRGPTRKARMKQHFSNSIYFIETAHNDYMSVAFKTADFDPVALMSTVIAFMRDALQALYDSGARIFLVMNMTPIGCNPSTISNPYRTENRDEYGCKTDYLELVNMHNEHVVKLLHAFRSRLPAAEWILYDAYSIMLDGYHNPSTYGIKYPFKACCGAGGTYNYNSEVECAQPAKYINGTYVQAKKCEDPSLYLIWDSLHPVESFCHYLAQGVLNGTHLYPTLNIKERFYSNKLS